MKTFILSFALFLGANIAQATIYRVGYTGLPVAGKDFNYNDLQGAVNTASANDTLQIYQQTATTSNSASTSKPLKFIGFGHSLNTNTGLQIQNAVDSSLNTTYLTFNPGSEGSVVQGLNMSGADIYASNINITRCRFKHGTLPSITYYYNGLPVNDCNTGLPFVIGNGGRIGIHSNSYNLTNITINGCYFDFVDNFQAQHYADNNDITCDGGYSIANLVISNNYFADGVKLQNDNSINGMVSGVFTNNIMNFKLRKLLNIGEAFIYDNSQTCTEGYFTNYPSWTGSKMQSGFDQFLIKNNIFNTADTVTWPLVANQSIVQNNVFSCASQYAGPYLGGTANVFKANMSAVFSSAWNDGMVLNDNQLALGASSAAINAGVKYNNATTNCGIFGGEVDQEYKLSGIPPVPAFYQLTTPSLNATTNPYNITISVRSNK